MNYYRRFMGDYASKTADLSLAEHGAYTVLLDISYSTEAGLPASYDALFRLCRAMSKAEQDAVKLVADRFFPICPDGLRRNPRAADEIAKAQATIDKQRKSGADSAAKRWSTDGSNHTGPIGSTDGSTHKSTDPAAIQPPTTNHQPPATNHQKNIVRLAPDVAGSSERKAAREAAGRSIAYLNEKAGTHYRATEANLKFAVDRLIVDKATEDDLRAVVDMKCQESSEGKFDRKYLRPETLWNATKFSGYIGQVGANPPAAERRVAI